MKCEWDHFLEGDFPPVSLNHDRSARQYKSLKMHPPFRELLVSRTFVGHWRDLENERARIARAWCVRARVRASLVRWYMCASVCPMIVEWATSLYLSLGWVALSLAHNKHGSKSPGDEARTGERSGPPKTCVSLRCETRPDTRVHRQLAMFVRRVDRSES